MALTRMGRIGESTARPVQEPAPRPEPQKRTSPMWAGRATRLVLVAVAAMSLLLDRGAGIPLAWQLVPLAASVIVLGLPHGALDHLVDARLTGRPLRVTSLMAFCGRYLLLVGLVVALWHIAPAVGLALFIASTVFHWGQGDLHGLLTLDGGRHLRGRLARVSALLLRGALPMLVPLVAFPEAYARGAARLVALFELPTAGLEAALRFELPVPAALVLVSLAALHVFLIRPRAGEAGDERRSIARDGRRDLRDVALLAAFFAAVPPTLSIGLYFCLWHSARHVARLMDLRSPEGEDSAGRSTPRVWRRFAVDAAPLTLAALALLIAQAALLPNRPDTVASWAAGYLVFIAALTVPHTWVVTRLDLAQGVWRAAGSTRMPSAPLVMESTGRRPASPRLGGRLLDQALPWFVRLLAHGR